jgi:Flp pilus assembly protein TadD
VIYEMARRRPATRIPGASGSTRQSFARLQALPACLFCLVLGACASTPPRQAVPAPLVQHHSTAIASDVDVLAVTPSMRRFLERYVLPYENPRTRLSLLMLAVTDKGVLGFYYNQSHTLTAAEAFERRSGNCVAFANLFVALAREAGLDARYQEVFLDPEWSSRDDTLLKAKHINVLVKVGRRSYMVDVSGEDISFGSNRRSLSDEQAAAMYFNNLGADALIQGANGEAYALFLRAIETEPGMADTWSNLGVLYGRNGQDLDAERAYLEAMRLNEGELAAMGNLHDLYHEQGRLAEAERLNREVERYRRENPYYLLALSEEAMEAGELVEANILLRRAIDLKPGEHLMYFTLARLEFLSGDIRSAEISLQRARELAPPEILREYQRPLEELVWRERARN